MSAIRAVNEDPGMDGESHGAATYGVLASRITPVDAIRLVTKDLALHAAIRYYETVLRIKGSYPPGVETVIRAAESFEDYYTDGEASAS